MSEQSVLSFPSLPLPYFLESGKTHYMPGESHPNRRNLGVFDLILVQRGCLFWARRTCSGHYVPGIWPY